MTTQPQPLLMCQLPHLLSLLPMLLLLLLMAAQAAAPAPPLMCLRLSSVTHW